MMNGQKGSKHQEKNNHKTVKLLLACILCVAVVLGLARCSTNHSPKSTIEVKKAVPTKVVSAVRKEIQPTQIQPQLTDTDAELASELDNSVGFTMSTPQTDAQEVNHRELSYPWLRVEPQKTYTQTIEIANGKVENTYTLIVSNSMTNINLTNVVYPTGSFDSQYVKSDSPVDFEKAATLDNGGHFVKFVLPANKTAMIQLTLQTTSAPFAGMAVGGIYLTREIRADERKKNSFTPRYNYSKALVLTESDASVAPKLEMKDSWLSAFNHRETVFLSLRNPTGAVIHEVTAELSLCDRTGKEISKRKIEEGTIVSYNTFHVTIPLEQKLEAGDYVLHAKIKGEEGNWQFDKKFTVNKEATRKLQRATIIDKSYQGRSRLPYVLILVLVGIIGILIWKMRRNKNGNIKNS